MISWNCQPAFLADPPEIEDPWIWGGDFQGLAPPIIRSCFIWWEALLPSGRAMPPFGGNNFPPKSLFWWYEEKWVSHYFDLLSDLMGSSPEKQPHQIHTYADLMGSGWKPGIRSGCRRFVIQIIVCVCLNFQNICISTWIFSDLCYTRLIKREETAVKLIHSFRTLTSWFQVKEVT